MTKKQIRTFLDERILRSMNDYMEYQEKGLRSTANDIITCVIEDVCIAWWLGIINFNDWSTITDTICRVGG